MWHLALINDIPLFSSSVSLSALHPNNSTRTLSALHSGLERAIWEARVVGHFFACLYYLLFSVDPLDLFNTITRVSSSSSQASLVLPSYLQFVLYVPLHYRCHSRLE